MIYVYNTLQHPSTLTEEDLAAVGVKCNDAAVLDYISEALVGATSMPTNLKELKAFIEVRFVRWCLV